MLCGMVIESSDFLPNRIIGPQVKVQSPSGSKVKPKKKGVMECYSNSEVNKPFR